MTALDLGFLLALFYLGLIGFAAFIYHIHIRIMRDFEGDKFDDDK